VLDHLTTHAHRLRVLIETLLHSFEQMFVLPSRDASLGSRRALRFERATRACRRPIAAQCLFSGQPVEAVRTLADLVSVQAFQALLRYLLERQNRKSTEALHGLAGALLAVGRHHVGVDKETETRLAKIVENLDVDAIGFRSKTRTRLMAFEDDRRVSALLHLPARLFAEAKAARSGRRRKQLCEMAIAIEILTFAPIRVGNLFHSGKV